MSNGNKFEVFERLVSKREFNFGNVFPKWGNIKAASIEIEVFRIWNISQELRQDLAGVVREEIIRDEPTLTPENTQENHVWWCLEKSLRPGVTDTAGKVFEEALSLIDSKFQGLRVSSGKKLWLHLPNEISKEEVNEFSRKVFYNSLIEWAEVSLLSEQKEGHPAFSVCVETSPSQNRSEAIALTNLNHAELLKLSEEKLWALSLDEMKSIQNYFREKGREPTDVECEVLAQTWSEHCKHKIFNATIHVKNERLDVALPQTVESVFKTYIRRPAQVLKPWFLRSIFEDNAGIIEINERYDVAIKVETHNSPSALDPYGGALTGIVGVNRDILGAGLGAEPIANLDVFCVGPLDASDVPQKLHHPRRILEGIRTGVEHGGNKSGIPTVTGAVTFHPGFMGKPLVFCGTLGLMPSKKSTGRDLIFKKITPGDLIVMVGGRIGKDGIHGATFSSLELTESSPVSAVQLGDPLTQRRVWDFLIEARDQNLYAAVTDNGAGGLSSSVGELAQLCGVRGGARLDVALAPCKYPGLTAAELIVSESQERMTLAVSPDKCETLLMLARARGVEASVLGRFEDSGKLEVLYQGESVGELELEFLHGGVPRLNLNARVSPKKSMPQGHGVVTQSWTDDHAQLLAALSHPEICSRKSLVEQYDHEVQARTTKKPYAGKGQLAPGDGATLRIERQSFNGVALGLGLHPRASEYDAAIAADLALDEAVRSAVAAGGDPDHMVLVDNFCWPDPLESPHNPDAQEKLGALVLSCDRLCQGALQLGMPFVSGKDSMKNDYRMGSQKISVPPTVLITAVGKVEDTRFVPGSQVGLAENESLWWVSGSPLGKDPWGYPFIDWRLAKNFYRKVHLALKNGIVSAIHDVSDGGWLVATAEMTLGSEQGARLNESCVEDIEGLFFESAASFVVAVSECNIARWLDLWKEESEKSTSLCKRVGSIVPEPGLTLELRDRKLKWSRAELEDAYFNKGIKL